MTGIDTNILVRYIVQDDKAQAAKATRLIESKCTARSPGYINIIVLCELVWVLKRAYSYKKRIIIDVLSTLLSVQEISVERSAEVSIALEEFSSGNGDFVDYLIAVINSQKGCDFTYTLDRTAAQYKGFKKL